MSLNENTSKIEQLLAAISALPEAGGSSDMPTVEQATPEISVSSSGLITATATQTAGYVEAGTKSATKQLTTKAAATYTPTTSNQTIPSGQYLTGTQTIMGDANLIAENIKKGVSIFDVMGIFEGSSGGGLPAGVSALACGERIVSTDTTSKVDVEHNLGVVPNFVVWMAESDTSSPVANMQVAGAIFGKKVEFTTNYINPLCYAVFGYNGSGSSNGTVSSGNNSTYVTTTTCAILGNSTYKLKSGVKYRWVCGVLDNIA